VAKYIYKNTVDREECKIADMLAWGELVAEENAKLFIVANLPLTQH